jgi:hypothetical protein
VAELRSDSCSLAPRRRWYEPAAIVAPEGPQGFVPLEMPSVALSESLGGLPSFGESCVAVHKGNCVAEPVIGWAAPARNLPRASDRPGVDFVEPMGPIT